MYFQTPLDEGGGTALSLSLSLPFSLRTSSASADRNANEQNNTQKKKCIKNRTKLHKIYLRIQEFEKEKKKLLTCDRFVIYNTSTSTSYTGIESTEIGGASCSGESGGATTGFLSSCSNGIVFRGFLKRKVDT